MRDTLNLILTVIIAILLVVGILSAIALGVATVTGFPFWFGFLIALILLAAWFMTLDEDGL